MLDFTADHQWEFWMPIWTFEGPGKVNSVAKVSRGPQHGFCKEISPSEVLGYHFAELLGVRTPIVEIGYVRGCLKLITINRDTNCCDLDEALQRGMEMGDALKTACAAFPFLSWLAHGDYMKLENWLREDVSGTITAIPIDFQCALNLKDKIIPTRFPTEFDIDKSLIAGGVSKLEALTDEAITTPMRQFGFDEYIEAAIWRRDNIRSDYHTAGFI